MVGHTRGQHVMRQIEVHITRTAYGVRYAVYRLRSTGYWVLGTGNDSH